MIRISSFLAILLFFLLPKIVLAVELNLDHPSDLASREFEFTYKTSGAKSGTNYLRLMIRKLGETNYVSETWNGTGWYSGGEGINYLPVQVGSFETMGTIKGRLKDGVHAGEYEVALRRYSQSGGQAQTTEFKKISLKFADPATPTPNPTKAVEISVASSTPTVEIATKKQETETLQEDMVVDLEGQKQEVLGGQKVSVEETLGFEDQIEVNKQDLNKQSLLEDVENSGAEHIKGEFPPIPIFIGLIGIVLVLLSAYRIAVKIKYLI